MKHHHSLFAASALALLTAACAGMLVRDNAAEPALASVWTRIRVDIEAELQVEPSPTHAAALAQADAALATGDELRMAGVPWQLLIDKARAGIERGTDDGSIHPAVAASLTERLVQFKQTINAYLKRVGS